LTSLDLNNNHILTFRRVGQL